MWGFKVTTESVTRVGNAGLVWKTAQLCFNAGLFGFFIIRKWYADVSGLLFGLYLVTVLLDVVSGGFLIKTVLDFAPVVPSTERDTRPLISNMEKYLLANAVAFVSLSLLALTSLSVEKQYVFLLIPSVTFCVDFVLAVRGLQIYLNRKKDLETGSATYTTTVRRDYPEDYAQIPINNP